MSRTLLLGILAFGSLSSAADAPDEVASRLAACSACHGEQGEGKTGNEYYPHLAGKPSGYLLAQLRAFREGRRAYPQMNWLMRNMRDEYLERIAGYYAALPPRSSAQPIPMSPADAERARQLTMEGDAARGLPACSSCHGGDLAGIEPSVPALLGLPSDYIVAQLGAWRTGTRRAADPDCMAEVAKALEPDDLRRLGEWLSSQGAGHSLRPAPAQSFDLPVPCGNTPAREKRP